MGFFWRSRNCLIEAFIVCSCYLLSSSFCFSLNDEGAALLKFKEGIISDPQGALSNWIDEVGVENPCSWFGVGCSNGYVAVLSLKDLCLRGTIAPDIGNLIHIKSIVLINNSLSGTIPDEIASLKELKVLDLRYNNFVGKLPCHLGDREMILLMLDNNELLDSSTSECRRSGSEQASTYDHLVISWKSMDSRVSGRKLLQKIDPLTLNFPPSASPLPPVPHFRRPGSTPSPVPSPSPLPSSSPSPTSSSTLPEVQQRSRSTKSSLAYILAASIVGPILLLLFGIGFYCYRSGKVSTVKPWRTGLSGQLQRAFVTGVPKLKRSELQAACEDFSNVIGSLSVCHLYKGTLSSGVEIAVVSVSAASKDDWSSSMETQFRKQIDTLSKVNHKNFVNLIGYCEEAEPFTRMLVFEYAPNGTLFEHLHIKEAEPLDWEMRIRVIMGMAYCLDHMHNLTPPLPHRNLTSSSVSLSEDYAAQVSDFIFLDKGAAAETQPTPQKNVYSFGVLLCEIITGKLPYTSGSDSVDNWASDYLEGLWPLREAVDQTLTTFVEDQLEEIEVVIKACVNPDPKQRLSMREVSEWLREITGIGPNEAIPKASPLWWAELEIMSTEAI